MAASHSISLTLDELLSDVSASVMILSNSTNLAPKAPTLGHNNAHLIGIIVEGLQTKVPSMERNMEVGLSG